MCPSNTFQATPMLSSLMGAKIKYVDCNKNDLCLSFEDLKKKIKIHKPAAVWVVHIGGHISFEIEKIAKYVKKRKFYFLKIVRILTEQVLN